MCSSDLGLLAAYRQLGRILGASDIFYCGDVWSYFAADRILFVDTPYIAEQKTTLHTNRTRPFDMTFSHKDEADALSFSGVDVNVVGRSATGL